MSSCIRCGGKKKQKTEVKLMVKSELMGYVRRSNNGKALKISINADAFGKAERYKTQDGQEYVAMIIRLDTIYQLIEGQKDVTNITQILNN